MDKLKIVGLSFGILILLFIGLVAIVGISNDTEQNELKNLNLSVFQIKRLSIDVDYQDLLDNNEKYVGEIVHYTGTINQLFHQHSNVYILNISGESDDNESFLVTYSGPEPKSSTKIEFYGKVTGTDTRQALLANTTLYFVTVDGLLISFP